MITLSNMNNNNNVTENIIHNNSNNSTINYDIENDSISISSFSISHMSKEDGSRLARIDDLSLLDVLKLDTSLMIFFAVIGFYCPCDNDSKAFGVIARLWQFIILIFGSIGLIWQLMFGVLKIKRFGILLVNATTSLDLCIAFFTVINDFIVPFTQAASLIYGIRVIKMKLKQTVNSEITIKLLQSTKRDAVIFFVVMSLCVLVIDPFEVYTPSQYEAGYVDYDDGYLIKTGLNTYPSYVFCILTTGFALNFLITCYLTLIICFLSLFLKQVQLSQRNLISAVENNDLTLSMYRKERDKIDEFQSSSNFATKLLFLTSAINLVALIFFLWFNHYLFLSGNNQVSSYGSMVILDFALLPFYLKGTTKLIQYIINTNNY